MEQFYNFKYSEIKVFKILPHSYKQLNYLQRLTCKLIYVFYKTERELLRH